MDRPQAITVDQLTKFFPAPWTRSRLMRPWQPMEPTRALWDVTLTVARGELVVLVGPNGSGKTTLLKILSSLILPTAGSVRILGMDPARQAEEVKARVGLITGDERSFYWRLSATENLRFFATLYGLQGEAARTRINWVLDLLQIDGPDRKVQVLSAGMKQRLAIARGLLADPPPSCCWMNPPGTWTRPRPAESRRSFATSWSNDRANRSSTRPTPYTRQ